MIEIFADIWCPFAYVGIRKAFEFRDEMGRADVPIFVRSWPLELVNNSPMSREKALGNCDALRQQVARNQFSNSELNNFPTTTLDALTLISYAYAQNVSAGEIASIIVREAVFEDGRDISNIAVLQDIAAGLGVAFHFDSAHSLVRRDWEEGKTRGVIGSPHFFSGSDGVFCPSLQLTRTEDHGLVIQTNAEKLEVFLRMHLENDA